MKKIALAAAVASALTAGVANAYNLNQEATGLVVPNVIHNGSSFTTAVGLVSRAATNVYWVFFDENSNHVADGQFSLTANDQHAFIWSSASGIGLENTRGYLVFTADNNGTLTDGEAINLMSGNAFQVNTTAKDVEFIPTIPLVANANMGATVAAAATSDYVITAPLNLTTMSGSSIQSARMTGVDHGDRLDMRYFIDNATGGNDTTIAFWNADELTGTPVTYTANMYNDAQARQSINFTLPKKNMNAIDVETIVGRPAAFLDGFIELTLGTGTAQPGLRVGAIGVGADGATATAVGDNCAVHYTMETLVAGDTAAPYTNCVGGVMAYSRVSSTAFGAVQTLMAAHD
ncbi:MAG: hypothetical protein ACOZAQ_09830 [Pseudomonadota bacterium]